MSKRKQKLLFEYFAPKVNKLSANWSDLNDKNRESIQTNNSIVTNQQSNNEILEPNETNEESHDICQKSGNESNELNAESLLKEMY